MGMCVDNLDTITHSTNFATSNLLDTYNIMYQGMIDEQIGLPEEGAKVSVYLQKLY